MSTTRHMYGNAVGDVVPVAVAVPDRFEGLHVSTRVGSSRLDVVVPRLQRHPQCPRCRRRSAKRFAELGVNPYAVVDTHRDRFDTTRTAPGDSPDSQALPNFVAIGGRDDQRPHPHPFYRFSLRRRGVPQVAVLHPEMA